jgi:cytochrome c oxidase subunit II
MVDHIRSSTKKYLLILSILSVFFIASCAQQTQTATQPPPKATVEPVVVEVDEPQIEVEDQRVEDDEVEIGDIHLDKPGYVVVHKVAGGKPGDVIGNSGLFEGEVHDSKVQISNYQNEKELIAMLHYDDGDGKYEFPGDDLPVIVNGKAVLQKFSLIGTSSIEEIVRIELPAETETEGSGVVEINMIAKQWVFEPAAVTVKQGDRVKLTIKSVDVAHGFGLPDFGVSRTLHPGSTEVIEFTADKKGTFTFFCNVFCGQGHSGMKGKLIVE